MRLNAHDEIRIDGIHPTNPATGVEIPAYLQMFALKSAQEGDVIDLAALWPYCREREPISMGRVRYINGRTIW